METHSNIMKIALDRDGDRSRRPATHPHRFERNSGSVFDVKSINLIENIERKIIPNSHTSKLENDNENNTKMYINSMPKAESINAKTEMETDHENHKKSCFPEV